MEVEPPRRCSPAAIQPHHSPRQLAPANEGLRPTRSPCASKAPTSAARSRTCSDEQSYSEAEREVLEKIERRRRCHQRLKLGHFVLSGVLLAVAAMIIIVAESRGETGGRARDIIILSVFAAFSFCTWCALCTLSVRYDRMRDVHEFHEAALADLAAMSPPSGEGRWRASVPEPSPALPDITGAVPPEVRRSASARVLERILIDVDGEGRSSRRTAGAAHAAHAKQPQQHGPPTQSPPPSATAAARRRLVLGESAPFVDCGQVCSLLLALLMGLLIFVVVYSPNNVADKIPFLDSRSPAGTVRPTTPRTPPGPFAASPPAAPALRPPPSPQQAPASLPRVPPSSPLPSAGGANRTAPPPPSPPPSSPPPPRAPSPPAPRPQAYTTCASVLREHGFSSAGLPSVGAGGGVYRLRPARGDEVLARCAFEGEGASSIAWTLFATKGGGWGSQAWAAAAPAWGQSLGAVLEGAVSSTPSLRADYKLPLGVPSAAEEAELGGQAHVLLTHLTGRLQADGLARVSRRLDRERTWAFGASSAQRRLDPLHSAGPGSAPRSLVFSLDGGVCLTADAGGGEFGCGAAAGVQDLLGLLDGSAAAELANCETFGWKANEADASPLVYLADSCYAPDYSFSARCTGGGTCVNPNCCRNMFQSDQVRCGTRMCQPWCRLVRAKFDACGSAPEWVLSGGWTNVWFGTSRSV